MVSNFIMEYRFAHAESYANYASGHVFYSLPGHSAFPVRLVSELFQRCLSHWQALGGHGRCALYDPCCGGAYHLSVLAYMHWSKIGYIAGSDINEDALQLAKRNLSLLTVPGIEARLTQVSALYAQYQKRSHAEAIRSIKQFQSELIPLMNTQPIITHLFQADALNTQPIQAGLQKTAVDIVLSDIPYGRVAQWYTDGVKQQHTQTSIWSYLEALQPILSEKSVVAIASNKQDKVQHETYNRLEQFQVGKRRITILRKGIKAN